MAKHTTRKIILAVLVILLLLAGGALYWLYQNRKRFIPTIEAVTALQIAYDHDTTLVKAGVRVMNRAPLPFIIDSVNYQIRSGDERIGWGRQPLGERLPALASKVLDFNLFLDLDRYRELLAHSQNQDSLNLDVLLQIYLNPPFIGQQLITVNRTFSTPIPKGPMVALDSVIVKSFSPEAGYVFLLKLNTENTNLPGLKIDNFRYRVRFADTLEITGAIDSTFHLAPDAKTVTVPLQLETNEMVALLRLKLGKQKLWPYTVQASGVIRAEHPLFNSTDISFQKSGVIDTRNVASGEVAMPSIKRLESLQLKTGPQTSYLQADLVLHNPTRLPLYLDSARYLVRHQGKIVASGARNFEQVFPAQRNQNLNLQLAINNQHYQQMVAHGQGEVPLTAEVFLFYNQEGSKPQKIAVKKQLSYPVMENPTFKLTNIAVKKIGPKQGAQLLLTMAVNSKTRFQVDDLDYRILVEKNLEITGQTHRVISVDTGASEIEIPVDLSTRDVNLLSKGLIRGQEIWDYSFAGTATVSVPNSLFQRTKIDLQTDGVFNVNSKGSPDYMPEISKIDTLFATIHYDSAWVRMYAAIYNTLPVTINVTQLEVDVKHEHELMGTTKEKLNVALLPDTNTFAWHSLGINYAEWEKHLKHHQNEDSILLQLPVNLTFELQDLGRQQVHLDLDTRLPTPATPVTLLERMMLRGFSFKTGLQFDALVAVQNANSEGLTVKNIDYQITLENGVDLCGKINRTYRFPIGLSEVKVPVNLSVWEGIKMFSRQLFGPPLINYKINATATVSTNNPKLSGVYVIFENHNVSNLKEEKTVKGGK